MAKPSGEIIETPITANFREGLAVIEYFISTHGARKGLADTALKTADSGYLTRRLVDVAQDVIIHEIDCGTMDGIEARAIVESGEIIEPLRDRIIGRVTLEKIVDPSHGELIVDVNERDRRGEGVGDPGRRHREGPHPLGADLRQPPRRAAPSATAATSSTGKLVELGLAVGVIAAQSIGEPGTQLTMRTFHIGGTASRVSEQSTLDAKHAGTVRYQGLQVVETKRSPTADRRAGRDEPHRLAWSSRTRRAAIASATRSSTARASRCATARRSSRARSWSSGIPYTFSILTEDAGAVKYKDLITDVTYPRGSRRGHRPVAEDHRRLARTRRSSR